MRSAAFRSLACAIFTAALVSAAAADTVQLTNGDTVSGKVVSLDGQSLTLKSEALGDVKIPRDKIAAIMLGERVLPAVVPPIGVRPADVKPAVKPLTAEPSVNDILKQIQSGGVDKSVTKGLEAELPLLANPEVKAYFNKTLGGLMTGDLSVSDLRKQAIDVRNQVKDLEKELGPEATQALSGYLGILESFIKETEPKTATEPKASAPAAEPKK